MASDKLPLLRPFGATLTRFYRANPVPRFLRLGMKRSFAAACTAAQSHSRSSGVEHPNRRPERSPLRLRLPTLVNAIYSEFSRPASPGALLWLHFRSDS